MLYRNLLFRVGIKGLIMMFKKDSGVGSVLLMLLFGMKVRKSDNVVDVLNLFYNLILVICYFLLRFLKNLMVLERESVENVMVLLY